MYAACLADCEPTQRAYISIIMHNVRARMRGQFKIELADNPAVTEAIALEVLRRLQNGQ